MHKNIINKKYKLYTDIPNNANNKLKMKTNKYNKKNKK